ncbi:hypothetical protein ACFVYE_44910 [Streptomyces sp. NPDC058239]|uniref:hypothetical protein n=1 Tax=unclassified Streptomyces TaxID=2593676 RepID=UPI00364CC2E5
MDDKFIASVVAAYTELYDPPTRTICFSRTGPPPYESAVVVYLPDEIEQLDPADNLTLLGTAGFGSVQLCADFSCELGMEVKGSLDEASVSALAEALADLASAPSESGRLFNDGQILTNVSLPVFPRFTMAMLIDWDSVYGFRFPEPVIEVGLLRVVPLFATEAEYVESFADRRRGYRALINQGMVPTDPDRDSTV